MKQTRAHTHIKKGFLSPPSLRCFDDARKTSQHEGAPLETGTDGRKETTHWSRVTTFCLFFSFLCWLHVKMSVFFIFFSIYKFFCVYVCVHPIIFNASVIDDQKVTFKGKNEDGIHFWIHTCKYIHEDFILEQTQSCTIRPAPMPPRKWIQLSVQLTNKDTK